MCIRDSRLGGPTCLAGDVIGDYSFAAPLTEGDRLIFGDMPIYSTCKNNTFKGMQMCIRDRYSRISFICQAKAFCRVCAKCFATLLPCLYLSLIHISNSVQQASGTIITTVKQGLLGGLGVEAIAGFSCAGKLSSPVSYTHLLRQQESNLRWGSQSPLPYRLAMAHR